MQLTRLHIINITVACCISIANAAHEHSAENIVINDCNNTAIQRCAKTMTSVFEKNGRLWSVWANGGFAYVKHSDDKGKTFSNRIKVNTVAEKIAARHEHRPKIKISPNGEIFISWTRKLKKRFTGDIRFSKSNNKGNSFSSPITVNDNRELINHRFDTLGINKKGHIYISWLDKRDNQKAKNSGEKYNGAAAYYAISQDAGNSFSKNIKIADNSCECCRMAMDFDKYDLPVIAWRHIYGDNIRDHSIVNFKSIIAHNKPLRLSKDNWKINGCPHHGPSLNIDNNNTYHTVWFTNADKQHGIFYANSHNQGEIFSKPLQIGSYENKASHADLISLNKSIFITWQEYEKENYKLYLMKSDNGGKNWDNPQLVKTSINTPDYPFLITDNEKVYISWHIPGEIYSLISVKK